MEDFKPKWQKSIFGRMLIVFTLMIVSLYIVSALIYNWAMNTVKKEISNTMLSQVSFYLDSLENQVKRMRWLQYDCVNDENLRQLAAIPESLDEYDMTKAIGRFQQRLVTIANSNEYIKNIKVYIPSINRTITTTLGGYETSINQEEFKVMQADANINETKIIYWQNRMFISLKYPTAAMRSDGGSKQLLFVIAVELSVDDLEKALRQFNSYDGGGALLKDYASRFTLTSTNSREERAKLGQLLTRLPGTGTSSIQSVDNHRSKYMIIDVRSDYLGLTLSRYIPENEVFKQMKGYYIWLWMITAIAVVLVVSYSLWTHRLIQKPLGKLMKSFIRMEKGDLNVQLEHDREDEFKYLYFRFNEMTGKLRQLIDQVYKQRILAQTAQLKQLQSQINPHFLYNSYFILHRMVTLEDNDNAAKFSHQLGTYLKFITRSASDDVPLEREVEHAAIYTEIQGMRFVSRIRVEFGRLPPEYAQVYVPRLILQPIIENAFEHGLENKARDGRLVIAFCPEEDALRIVVEDNGDGIRKEEQERLNRLLEDEDTIDSVENTGIINIHRRLKYKFGEGSGLHFQHSEMGGLQVVIRIALPNGGQGNLLGGTNHVQASDC